ncbi:glycine cleavage system protein GcvH [Ferrimicrobium acidiphilum]|uniref:glycine cleavage system protein GcvH n=1 Tax=Ferrimicrobium acidiphilum TaxID=121039 RepID=UPI0023F02516|nr:glycine cleavage system protein GcvH [Ferrimicrobium acidiphilum]
MSKANGCDLPEDLYYLIEKHVWARPDGDEVIIGLTDVAQNMAKTIISVSLKAAAKPIKRGRSLATVESGKWVGPVPCPVEGEVISVNERLMTSPGLLNSDPYGEGWVARVRPNDWSSDVTQLVTGADGVGAYREFLDAEGIVCSD